MQVGDHRSDVRCPHESRRNGCAKKCNGNANAEPTGNINSCPVIDRAIDQEISHQFTFRVTNDLRHGMELRHFACADPILSIA